MPLNAPRQPILIPGRRIVLRDFHEDDIGEYLRWQAPGHHWHRLDGPYYPKPSADDLSRIEQRLREDLQTANWPEPRKRLVIADDETDLLIGVVTWSWESRETCWLSVGIVIFDPDLWGSGRGYEALGLWTQYLFDTMPALVRSDLRTWSGNTAMMRLAEKLGYREEARFRQARIVEGEYFDGLGYGVLRHEWTTRYPDGFAASLQHHPSSRAHRP